ncbi:MAG: hypothetical protein IKB04_04080 [Clostridia bacterium]|nr:hypothetical protein [Clostridia bacterium]
MEKSLLKLEQGNLPCGDDNCFDDEFQGIQFDLVCPNATDDENRARIQQGLCDVEQRLSVVNKKVAELNADIENLTNNADGLDYTIAVASGILTGLIDSFFVGELGLFENASDEAKAQFREAKGESNKIVNKFVEKYAKMRGYNPKDGGDLKGAISFLEEKFPVANDNTWSGQGISSTHTHHLDDLAHHPTLMGLVSSILVQFFRISFFASKDGKVHPRIVETSMKDLSCWIPVVISGVLKWLSYMAEKNDLLDMDDDLPESVKWLVKNIHKVPIILQLAKVADNWFGHIVSDMGGSKSTAGGGTGVSGIFISLLKEISMLPGVKDTELPKIVNDLYASKKYTTDKVDLRTEIAVIKKQAMPVIINEVIVRTFYFVRHFVSEYQEHKSLTEMNWRTVIPFGNRTVVRMMTIASGTFTAVDMADAGIRAVIKSGGFNPATLSNFVLNVNFVGVGRFAIAVATDVGMGVKKGIKENKRLDLVGQQLQLMNVKVSYQQADMWVSAKDAGEAINEAYEMVVPAVETIVTTWAETDKKVDDIVNTLEKENEEYAVLETFLTMYDESQG